MSTRRDSSLRSQVVSLFTVTLVFLLLQMSYSILSVGDYYGDYLPHCNFPGEIFHRGGFPFPSPVTLNKLFLLKIVEEILIIDGNRYGIPEKPFLAVIYVIIGNHFQNFSPLGLCVVCRYVTELFHIIYRLINSMNIRRIPCGSWEFE